MRELIERYAGNPILKPEDIPGRANRMFNSGAVVHDGEVIMRAWPWPLPASASWPRPAWPTARPNTAAEPLYRRRAAVPPAPLSPLSHPTLQVVGPSLME